MKKILAVSNNPEFKKIAKICFPEEDNIITFKHIKDIGFDELSKKDYDILISDSNRINDAVNVAIYDYEYTNTDDRDTVVDEDALSKKNKSAETEDSPVEEQSQQPEAKPEPESSIDSENVFRNIFDNIKFMAVMIDTEGKILYCNESLLDATGWEAEETLGSNWFDLFIPPDRIENAKSIFFSMLESGFVLTHYEDFIQTRTGERHLVFWNNSILRDSSGKIIGAASIGDDVTSRRRADIERNIFANLGTRLVSAKTIESIGDIIKDETDHLFGWDSGYIAIKLSEISECFSRVDYIKEMGNIIITGTKKWYESDISESYHPLFSGKPIFINKKSESEEEQKNDSDESSCGSLIIAPITSKRNVIGVISIKSKTYGKYNIDDVKLLERFAETISPIIERVYAENSLRISEERYALAAKAANDGLWDWNLDTNEIYLSSRWKSTLGYDDKEIGTSPEEWFKIVHEEDLVSLKAHLNAQIKSHTNNLNYEYRIKHKNGTFRWVLIRGVTVRDEHNVSYRMAGSQTDITERKSAENQLLHGAFYDTLTDLPNRSLFLDRLGRGIERAKRNESYLFAVLFLDIDRFKNINDSMGHATGDQLLIDIAARLKKCIRPSDTVARMGGDEFTVFLDDVKDHEVALTISQRIHNDLKIPFKIYNNEIVLTVSIGIALSSIGYDKADDILRDADTAMYQAKGIGKACHVVFDKEMHHRIVNSLELENDLRKAIDNNELQVFYQPIISLVDGRIKGFEALLRWFHPKRGLVSPVEFIPIAEDTGIIYNIARWVLITSCRQLNKWNQKFKDLSPLRVSVNISGKWFSQESLAEQIKTILKEEKYDPKNLIVEITESTVMKHAEETIETLKKLKMLNVRIAIDDFGTGYSSLSYLHKFPIDVLKIDRSFVTRMSENGEAVEIVRTIMALAKTLKIHVVAEGVEDVGELNQLRELECDYVQGFYLARPADHEKIEALLEKNPQW